MRNKLGIIPLKLSSIQLDDTFGSGSATEITDVLSEEQKEIIKTRGDTKLVYLEIDSIEDSSSSVMNSIKGIMCVIENILFITIYNLDNEQTLYLILYEDSGKYYIAL